MAKKRRTRAQKMRAQQRRVSQPETLVQTPKPAAELAKKPVQKPVVKPETQTAEQPIKTAKIKKPSELRLSLAIFGALIAAQLVLWLVFSFTALDNGLYELIKL